MIVPMTYRMQPTLIRVHVIILCRGCDCQAIVYDSSNFGGHSLLIKQQNANFRYSFFDDRVESIKIMGSCSFIFYEHPGFNDHDWDSAKSFLLQPGDYSSPQTWGGPRNTISSARALQPRGTNAIAIFEHPYFCGAMTVLYNSHTYLPHIDFNDKISSVIVTGGSWSLFDHPSFTGVSVTRYTGTYPWSTLMDRVSSIRKNY